MGIPKKVLHDVYQFVDVEPFLFTYMLSSYLYGPIEASLVYIKACYNEYNDDVLCGNMTAIRSDITLQTEASHVLLYGSLSTIPSLFVAPLIGIYADSYSRKVAMLIPLATCIVSDIWYIAHAGYLRPHPYFTVYTMIAGEFVFAIGGGYAAVIAATASYAGERCKVLGAYPISLKMASYEGAIALGITLGYVASGHLQAACGYPYSFLVVTGLHFVCFLFVIVKVEHDFRHGELRVADEPTAVRWSLSSLLGLLWDQYRDFARTIVKPRPTRSLILLCFASFGLDFLVFSGAESITYYYLVNVLDFTLLNYGTFKGVYNALTTAAVLTLYPLAVRFLRSNDLTLSSLGMVSRITGLLLLAFPISQTVVLYAVPVANLLARFISTGLRATMSLCVDNHEQGKLFAAVGVLEGAVQLIAASTFNSVYPASLHFWSGFCFVLLAFFQVVTLVTCLSARCLFRTVTFPGVSRKTTHSMSAVSDFNQAF